MKIGSSLLPSLFSCYAVQTFQSRANIITFILDLQSSSWSDFQSHAKYRGPYSPAVCRLQKGDSRQVEEIEVAQK